MIKEPVKIRFKELQDGRKSVYLEIYADGKRKYEFLKMYLLPTTAQRYKNHNQNVLTCANNIKAKRIIELNRAKAQLLPTIAKEITLCDYVAAYIERQKARNHTQIATGYNAMLKILTGYNNKITLFETDDNFCADFIAHLRTMPKYTPEQIQAAAADKNTEQIQEMKEARRYAEYSVYQYITYLCAVLNYAVKHAHISINPLKMMERADKPKKPQTTRTYLTKDEIKAFQSAKITIKQRYIQNAFLFACFCGLRISDIRALKWDDIKETDTGSQIEIIQTKTKETIFLPLSDTARKLLPERSNKTDYVFALPDHRFVNRTLKHIAKVANINKNISFHTSRHTFATLLLTQGADIYTTSKLLGHSSVSTTEIYAKVIDRKKTDAVNLCNGII